MLFIEYASSPSKTRNNVIEKSKNAQKAVLYLDDEKKHRKVVSSHDKEFINLLLEKEWVGKKVGFKAGQIVSY